jgi:hypothetical protein
MYIHIYGHLPLVLYAQPGGDCKTSDVRRPYGVILRCGHARRCGWKPNDIRLLWLVSLGCLVGVSGPGPSWARPGCCLCPFCCCLFALCLSLRCLSFYNPFSRLRVCGVLPGVGIYIQKKRNTIKIGRTFGDCSG